MARELSNLEIDTVMANVYPPFRRLCPLFVSRGVDTGHVAPLGCACIGCIGNLLSEEDFAVWVEREANREPTPYVVDDVIPHNNPPNLQSRLMAFKARKSEKP